jgi:TatD DNase family protein
VLDRGLMVSFCGPLTYPSARRLREAAAYVPLDAILTETDCPDLPPQAVAGGLSLPHHVRYVVEAIAAVKGLSLAAVAAQVEANYRALLRLS